jgi:hypothetical protein
MLRGSIGSWSVDFREPCVAIVKYGRDVHVVVGVMVLTTWSVAYRSPIVVDSADSRANSDGLN